MTTADQTEPQEIDLGGKALIYAIAAHKDQRRKYTGEPYYRHLQEVAAWTAVALKDHPDFPTLFNIAILHDVIEDTDITFDQIVEEFDRPTAIGVLALSDLEEGNRFQRKRMSRARLATQSAEIQTIKVADCLSNASSIIANDPAFARVFCKEVRELLKVLNLADPDLKAMLKGQIDDFLGPDPKPSIVSDAV